MNYLHYQIMHLNCCLVHVVNLPVSIQLYLSLEGSCLTSAQVEPKKACSCDGRCVNQA